MICLPCVKKQSLCEAEHVFPMTLHLNGGWGEGLPWWLSVGKESACHAGDRVRSLGQKDPLEKGMAAHSGILAWRIPWTEEPDGLQSMGSQRVRHA